MRNPVSGKVIRRLRVFLNPKFFLVFFIAVALCMATYGSLGDKIRAVASPPPFAEDTFYLSAMFPRQMLSPSTGRTATWTFIDTFNIGEQAGNITLSAQVESPYFKACVLPSIVKPTTGYAAKSLVWMTCSPSTPEGTVGWIKIIGTRGGEQHHIWLKLTALASQPLLEFSRGEMLGGQGYRDPELKPYVGAPLTWCLAATNQGGENETFQLGYSADFPCQVRFLDSGGNPISQVKVNALTRNYLYASPVQLKAEIIPTAPLPKNQPKTVTLTLGPGTYTTSTSQVQVQLFNPGLLWCVNALDGPRPHAHQIMPGEKTTFIFHLTNLDGAAADISLNPPAVFGDWQVSLQPLNFQAVQPGKTVQAIMEVLPGPSIVPGDSLEVTVNAHSSTGREEQSTVSVEVSERRNVYYWSVDSLDPAYLELNRLGTGPGHEGDWLMPNLRAFISQAVNYTNARAYLPAATDMNHTNALAGTYTGTAGIFNVTGTFVDFTEHHEVITAYNSTDLMLYGSGEPVKRVFEVAKEVSGGKSLTGFWSNKNWLADLEGGRNVDIVGSSERFPLFFPPPNKYSSGDPKTDTNPADPMSGPFSSCFYSNTLAEIVIPTLLGQFNLLLGLGMYVVPVSMFMGMNPGMHSEDRYIAESFFRSIQEEDPDVSYINIADLDNTGHLTGCSLPGPEWDTRGTPSPIDDLSRYNPWMRRDECLDHCREADELFGQFIQLLKERGVYDNSVIVFLSDHGMENVKDPQRGYETIDLREILRERGLTHFEDYIEVGGGGINFIYCDDPSIRDFIQQTLEDFTIDDPQLGPVKPLMVIDREEMENGVDYGPFGRLRPGELYSEYWINHPHQPGGQLWPDLFVFSVYNYQVVAHGDYLASGANAIGMVLAMPDSVKLGFPASHGGFQTSHIALVFKAPAGLGSYPPGTQYHGEAEIGSIAPTIYQLLGWPVPGCVDAGPLPQP